MFMQNGNFFYWLAPLISFVSTFAGVVVLLLGTKRLSPRLMTILTGASGGVMLSAAILSLLMPGVDIYKRDELSRLVAVATVTVLLLVGAVLMELIHKTVPHEHFVKEEGGGKREVRMKQRFRRAWLILFAMGLHNIPEGLAIGIGMASGDAAIGWPLAVGIAAQNVPEAAMLCLAIIATGGTVRFAVIATIITGGIEALAAFVGTFGLSAFATLLPASLVLCAGAMIYVVSQEMIPESHSHGLERPATFSLMIGFAMMTAMTMYIS